MADNDILGLLGTNDLLGFNQAVQQTDPYGIAGRSIASWQPNYSVMSPTEGAISAFGKSFLAGLLGNYAQQRASDQLSSVVNVLPQLRSDPYNVAAPEGVDSSAFNLLKGTAIVKNEQRRALTKEENTKNLSDILKTVLGEGVKAGTISAGDVIKAAATGDYSGVLNTTVDSTKNPNSPQYKFDKDQEEKLITIRKEFNALEPVKNFAKASQAARALAGALKDQNKVADQELVRYSILMIEPGMAVREGEQGAVAASQSIPEAWKGELQSALSGKSKLGQDVREGIKNLATRAYTSHKNLYDQANELYSKEASLQGIDPSRLSYIGQAPAAEEIFGAVTPKMDVEILSKPPSSPLEIKAALSKILTEMNNPLTSFQRKQELKNLANSLVKKNNPVNLTNGTPLG